jgi:hypothetical protein
MRKKRIGVGDTVTATLYLMVLTHAIRHSQPAVNMHSRSSLVLLLFQLTAASNRKVQPHGKKMQPQAKKKTRLSHKKDHEKRTIGHVKREHTKQKLILHLVTSHLKFTTEQ